MAEKRLSRSVLEALRMQAVRIFENGSHYTDVMAALGAKRLTVLKWQALYRRGGVDALVVTPPSGRPAKLADEHLPRLYALILNNTPHQVGLEDARWTRDLVRQLVLSEFGVDLSRVSVGRLLARIGMSPQRPLYRAYQQDPEKVRRWKEEEFPAIRAQAKAEGAALYFVAEASLRTDHHAGTTWASSGRTPVVTSNRTTVNMISAVTPPGDLAFDVFTGSCPPPSSSSSSKDLSPTRKVARFTSSPTGHGSTSPGPSPGTSNPLKESCACSSCPRPRRS